MREFATSGYPGNRPHHHQQQGFPEPQPYGGGYSAGYGPPPGPPPQQYNQGYQPNYGGGGGYNQGGGGYGAPPPQFPHPGHHQQYAPPPGMPNVPQYQQPSGPPAMSYNDPNISRNYGPPQYQGGQFAVHTQAQGAAGQFQYSNCSGKRKALCIGINYTGTANALAGCHNDARNISKFLIERYHFSKDDMVILMDTQGASQMELPTKANILRAMQWLVRDARPNDSLFFHYSGHGGQTEDLDGDEDDGYDETIYPLDFKQAGQIVDDQMHDIMVRSLPQGCRLTAIFDSCHSGSALDLPYIYSTEGKLKEPNLLADAGKGAMGAVKSYMQGDLSGVFSTLTSVGKKIATGNSNQAAVRQAKMSNADCISWSGCKDDQTSADASEAGKATGAMSFAFIAALTKYPQMSYMQMLNVIRDELRGRYSQKPQLSCSHELDCNLLFVV